MTFDDAGVLAGTVSTPLFVLSYLAMLIKARRSRDLASYSAGNLVIANVGNLVYSVYVVSLPVGPIWVLHIFYVLGSAAMLWWWWRFHGRAARTARRADPRGAASWRHDTAAAQVEPELVTRDVWVTEEAGLRQLA